MVLIWLVGKYHLCQDSPLEHYFGTTKHLCVCVVILWFHANIPFFSSHSPLDAACLEFIIATMGRSWWFSNCNAFPIFIIWYSIVKNSFSNLYLFLLVQWFITHQYDYFDALIFSDMDRRCPFQLDVSSNLFSSFFQDFLCIWHNKMVQAHLLLSLTLIWISYVSKKAWCF